jgi:hypothetical protein
MFFAGLLRRAERKRKIYQRRAGAFRFPALMEIDRLTRVTLVSPLISSRK